MKKRLFAGALALLMIIGLLPVSSMMKKPVEAQAAQKTSIYSVGNLKKGNVSGSIGTDNCFTLDGSETFSIGSPGSYSDGIKEYGIKLANTGAEKQCIKFTPKTSKSKLTIIGIYKGSSDAEVSLQGADENAQKKTIAKISGKSAEKFEISFDIESNANTEYSLYRSAGTTVYINTIELTEDPYTITVNDEKAADGSQSVSTFYKEGESVSYTAQGEEANFDYWENSHGVKVSTNRTLNIPVYYSDTYTAVYKKAGAKVVYYTPYGGVYRTYYENDVFTEAPGVPKLYGYADGKWNQDYDTVKNLLKNATDSSEISVKPEYPTNDSSMNYTINIDATKFGKESVEKLSKVVNELVTASIDSNKENFAYWKDDKGNIVSYNPTYYFLANRNVTVTAVDKETAKTGNEADLEKQGKITTIYDESKSNRTVIFEYTVPDDFTMKYVGVLGSTNEDILTKAVVNVESKGVYQLGNSNCSGYKTFRYTLNIVGSETWYVKPVLIYSNADGVQQDPVYGSKLTIE